MERKITLMVFVLSSVLILSGFSTSAFAAPETLFMVTKGSDTFSPSQLWTVDKTTGIATALPSPVGFIACTSIDFKSGILYGACEDNIQTNLLSSINPVTGIGTSIGFNGGGANYPGMAVHPTTGTMYTYQSAQGFGGSGLGTLNLGTGAYTAIDASSTTGGNGMAFSSGGTLYIARADGGGPDTINTVNLANGDEAASAVIGYVSPLADNDRTTAMDFDSTGILWAAIKKSGQSGSAYLATINPGTGAMNTPVLITTNGVTPVVGVDGIAFAFTSDFGDFKCWEFVSGTTVPPAQFLITDQFNTQVPIENELWEQAAYCAAASKQTFTGQWTSPFESTGWNQHYQQWFYPFGVPNAGTGTTVILDVPQFDHQFTVILGELDSILVPATKHFQSGPPEESEDFFQHWNCYNIDDDTINVEMSLETQHGPQDAFVQDPFLLCAPMEKFDPFSQTAFGDPTLNEHMVCYDIEASPAPGPLPVSLEDQLTSGPLPINIDLNAQIFCAPAFKSFPTVGGADISINTSALLLAGVQSTSMWTIPVILAGIGIGVFVIKRRN